MKRTLLLASCLLTLCLSQAQDANDYYGKELVVNGDASNGTNGWTSSGWENGGIHTSSYSSLDFSAENIPTGMNGDDQLFCGNQDQSLWEVGSGFHNASYQIIQLPADLQTSINNSEVVARMSALAGGYEGQDDYVKIVYQFMDAQGSVKKTVEIGNVKAGDRNKTTQLIPVESTFTLLSGITQVKVEIQCYEEEAGYATDGYVDNVSLKLEQATFTPSITVNAAPALGENINANYSGLPGGCQLLLFKDLGSVALNPSLTIEGDRLDNSGVFEIGNQLELGDYTIKAVNESGAEIISAFFSIAAPTTERKDKNIMVLSDIHVMAPSLLVQAGSAFEEYLASDRKLLQESEDILATMISKIIESHPDLVLIPGDLTKDGERASHEMVVDYLNQLQAEGIQVLVVPGNHDVNNPNAHLYNGDHTEFASTVSAEEFASLYEAYGYGQNVKRDENSLSYAAEVLDNLVVLGIDGCMYEKNTFQSQGDSADICITDGRIKPSTLEWLCNQAQEANRSGKQVIAIMHHNLVEHFNGQASIASPYVIREDSLVKEQFMQAGIRVVFTGHFHISDIAMDYNSTKTDSIYDIATGSTVTYPCPYRYVTLNENNTIVEIESRLLKDVPAYEDFDSYARTKLHDGLEPMVRRLIDDYWDVINQTVNDMIAGYGSLLEGQLNMPQTPEELSNLLLLHLKKPGIDTYLTFSESNEHQKKTDEVMDAINVGIDGILHSLVKEGLLQSTIIGEIKKALQPMADEMLGSILYNKTNYGTANESQSNDLYLAFALPEQEAEDTTPTGNKHITDDRCTINAYPSLSDGWVNITCSHIPYDTRLIIYDQLGRVLHQENVKAGSEYSTSYNFSQPGVYLIKLIGENGSARVIIK